MLNYLDTKSVLFTRGVSFDLKQYLYVVQVVLGEDKSVAYGMTFDRENFVKAIGSEDEDDYLSKVARDAEIMMQQQECQGKHFGKLQIQRCRGSTTFGQPFAQPLART